MTLPTDVCRCHDRRCREREDCARWVDRDVPINQVRASSRTLRPAALLPHEPCPFRLPREVD